jgi:tetratricopeptide (TPR) repeat protein
VPAHYFAAGILMTRKEYAAAAGHYAQIAEVDKQGANPRYLWGVALANQDQRKLAAAKLREALTLDPGHAKARDLLRIVEE